MIYLDENELTRIVREAVRKEMEPFKRLMEDRKLTMDEVAKLLNVKSTNTIRSLIRRGKLVNRPDRPGGRPRFVLSEVMSLGEYLKK